MKTTILFHAQDTPGGDVQTAQGVVLTLCVWLQSLTSLHNVQYFMFHVVPLCFTQRSVYSLAPRCAVNLLPC